MTYFHPALSRRRARGRLPLLSRAHVGPCGGAISPSYATAAVARLVHGRVGPFSLGGATSLAATVPAAACLASSHAAAARLAAAIFAAACLASSHAAAAGLTRAVPAAARLASCPVPVARTVDATVARTAGAAAFLASTPAAVARAVGATFPHTVPAAITRTVPAAIARIARTVPAAVARTAFCAAVARAVRAAVRAARAAAAAAAVAAAARPAATTMVGRCASRRLARTKRWPGPGLSPDPNPHRGGGCPSCEAQTLGASRTPPTPRLGALFPSGPHSLLPTPSPFHILLPSSARLATSIAARGRPVAAARACHIGAPAAASPAAAGAAGAAAALLLLLPPPPPLP